MKKFIAACLTAGAVMLTFTAASFAAVPVLRHGSEHHSGLYGYGTTSGHIHYVGCGHAGYEPHTHYIGCGHAGYEQHTHYIGCGHAGYGAHIHYPGCGHTGYTTTAPATNASAAPATPANEQKAPADNTAIVLSAPITPQKVPSVSAKAAGAKKVTVKWSKTNGASGYEIYRSTNNKNFTKIGTAANGKTTTFTDTNAKANTKYYYKVRAYNKSGTDKTNGAFSKVCSVKTAK